MPNCSKCERRIRTGSLCDMCRVERNHAGVEPEWDAEPRCGVCHDPAPEGDYAGDEQDPGIETGFAPASARVAADGGQQLCGHCEEPIDRDADDPPLTFEGEDIHWDCLDEAMEAADDAEWDTDAEVAADGGEA